MTGYLSQGIQNRVGMDRAKTRLFSPRRKLTRPLGNGFVPHGRVELGAVVGRAKAFLLRNLKHRRVGTDAVNDARVQRPVSAEEAS